MPPRHGLSPFALASGSVHKAANTREDPPVKLMSPNHLARVCEEVPALTMPLTVEWREARHEFACPNVSAKVVDANGTAFLVKAFREMDADIFAEMAAQEMALTDRLADAPKGRVARCLGAAHATTTLVHAFVEGPLLMPVLEEVEDKDGLVTDLMEWLAHFHGPDTGETIPCFELLDDWWHIVNRDIEVGRNPAPEMRRFLVAFDRFKEADYLVEGAVSPVATLHNDAHLRNFFVTEAGIVGIDMDMVGPGPAIVEVANILSRVVFRLGMVSGEPVASHRDDPRLANLVDLYADIRDCRVDADLVDACLCKELLRCWYRQFGTVQRFTPKQSRLLQVMGTVDLILDRLG
ncbi:phosphotransferase [Pseudaestuariivita sp.]|uniref:phosphotransferase n=1 Tax=Pseudaestuariivita sp. TaxID=2211669 RepID=UPI0040581152